MALLAKMELMDVQDLRVHRDPKVYRDLKGLRERRERKEKKEKLDLRVLQEKTATGSDLITNSVNVATTLVINQSIKITNFSSVLSIRIISSRVSSLTKDVVAMILKAGQILKEQLFKNADGTTSTSINRQLISKCATINSTSVLTESFYIHSGVTLLSLISMTLSIREDVHK
jgi:hypothetical protein